MLPAVSFRCVNSAAAAAVALAAAGAVVAPNHQDDDEDNDPPPAVAESADAGRIARHTVYLLKSISQRFRWSFHHMPQVQKGYDPVRINERFLPQKKILKKAEKK